MASRYSSSYNITKNDENLACKISDISQKDLTRTYKKFENANWGNEIKPLWEAMQKIEEFQKLIKCTNSKWYY